MEPKKIPRPKHGDCELCGGKGRDLYMLFVGDFAGYACTECISQVQKCTARRYCAAGEETEPAE